MTIQMQFEILPFILLSTLHLAVNYVLNGLAVEDEVLHAEQARSYYSGNFTSWNPMITTPPGLYFVSLLMCSPRLHSFRLVNLIFGMLMLLERNGLTIVLMPIVFPFTLLFYTDCGSLLFVLFAEHLYQHEHYLYSALAGLTSITFRQTNIIWVGRLAAMSLIDYWNNEITFTELLYSVMWYVPVLAAFLCFVRWNKGVVLGDRKNHQPCCNIPQLFYCLLTIFLLTLPLQIAGEAKTKLLPRPALIALSFLHLMALKYFSYEHPYHGPESRHITSFLLRSCFTGTRKFLWIPVYIYAEHVVAANLYGSFGFPGTVLILLCMALTTIPSRLVEPRYYIIPAAILMKSLTLPKEQYYATLLAYAVVDVLLLALMIVPVPLGLNPIIW